MKKMGFTLTEMIVVMGIAVTVLLIFGLLFIRSLESCGAIKTEVNIQKEARKALYQLGSELKRTSRTTVTFPATNSISFELPVFQISTSNCSAHATNPSSSSPVSCLSGGISDCVTACGGVSADWSCPTVTRICNKRYTYSLIANNGIPQLISSATGESDRILANGVQSMSFQTSGGGSSLRQNEISIQLMAQDTSSYENRLRQESLQTVVQVRN